MSQPATARAPDKARRADGYDQPSVLRSALATLGARADIAVFDLDSTLLDNRPRQARILAEYGAQAGEARLLAARPEHWTGWDLVPALRACGLGDDELERHREPAKAFWRERFFTSEYCRDDVAIAGASAFLQHVTARGATLCYVTGRHTAMGPGSLEAFRRAGFPLPNDHAHIHLLLKPAVELDDDRWKVLVREQLAAIGRVACAFDNEPVHINGYRDGFPGCFAVHLDTDHSGRPVDVRDDIPSVRDFML